MIRRILETYRAAFRGLSREVWILSLVMLVNRSGTMVVIFLVPYLTKLRGYSPAEAGSLLAVYGAGTMCGIYLGGRLADRISARIIILTSLVLTSAILFGLGHLQSTWAIATGFLAFGVIAETLRPAVSVAIANYSRPENRSRAFGLYRLCINLGMTVGPVLGGILATIDYAWLFNVDGGTCLLAAILFHRHFPKSAPPHSTTTKEKPSQTPIWRDRTMRSAMFLTFLHAIIFFQLASTLPLYLLEQRGYSELKFSGLFSVNTIIIVLFEMVLVRSIERKSPMKIVAIAGLLTGLGFGLTPYATNLPLLLGTVLIWTMGEMLAAPMMQTWVANRAGEHNRGQYLAAFAMVFSVAHVVAPASGLFVYQHIGPDWVWHACLLLGILQLFGFWRLARKDECR